MSASGIVTIDVDIPLRSDSKPCDFKGEGSALFRCGQQANNVTRNAVHPSGEHAHAQAGKAACLKAPAATNDRQQGAHRTTQVC